ncbi:MAG: PEP-CTERM sorting domain-containing protein [Pirellulales bacterium]|nr:PEP-CTERM sorting domain-containing protein [Pirellulales bacterium]
MKLIHRFFKFSSVITCCLLLVASVHAGGDLTSIVFESGNLDPIGTGNGNWEFMSLNGTNGGAGRATIGSTGRTFQTGTAANDEALFINPVITGEGNSFGDGAVLLPSTPFTVGATDYVYVVTETFADMSAFSDQYFKVNVRFGKNGDGVNDEFLGYEGNGPPGTIDGSTWSVDSNFNTEPSSGNRQNRAKVEDSGGSGQTGEFRDLKYVGDDVNGFTGSDNNAFSGNADNNFLDRTYVATTLFRPNSAGMNVNYEAKGVAAPSDGTAVSASNSYTNIGEGTVGTTDTKASSAGGYGVSSFDRITVHMRRHVGAYDGPGGATDEGLNGFAGATGYASSAVLSADPATAGGLFHEISNATDFKIGIKSLRIGITGPGDTDIDGDVDTADITTALSNYSGAGGSMSETAFTGDADNDMDVDTNDITIALTNFGPVPLAAIGPGNPDLIYDKGTGNVRVRADGATIGSFNLQSAGNFSPPADFSDLDNDVLGGALTGLTDNDNNQIGWISGAVTSGIGFDGPADADLGNVFPTGLTLTGLQSLLTNNAWASPVGVSGSGAFDLQVVPEPASMLLLGLGGLALAGIRRRV